MSFEKEYDLKGLLKEMIKAINTHAEILSTLIKPDVIDFQHPSLEDFKKKAPESTPVKKEEPQLQSKTNDNYPMPSKFLSDLEKNPKQKIDYGKLESYKFGDDGQTWYKYERLMKKDHNILDIAENGNARVGEHILLNNGEEMILIEFVGPKTIKISAGKFQNWDGNEQSINKNSNYKVWKDVDNSILYNITLTYNGRKFISAESESDGQKVKIEIYQFGNKLYLSTDAETTNYGDIPRIEFPVSYGYSIMIPKIDKYAAPTTIQPEQQPVVPVLRIQRVTKMNYNSIFNRLKYN